MKNASNQILSYLRNERCLHLGLKDDPATTLGFPSKWNYCYYARPIAPVRLEHQRLVCQTANHSACIVLQNPNRGPLPSNLRSRRSPTSRRKKKRFPTFMVAMFILLIAALIVVFAASNLSVPGFTWDPAGWWPKLPTSSTPIRSPLPATAVVPESAGVLVALPMATESATSTPLSTRTSLPQRHALEVVVFVGDRRFLIHRVKGGETFELLAGAYNTTPDVIRALNYKLKASLWEDTEIVLSPGMDQVDSSLPVFETFQVKARTTTIDELGKEIGVLPGPLHVYNGCEGNCQLVEGDWVIVPRISSVTP